jgi:hypothetical protein
MLSDGKASYGALESQVVVQKKESYSKTLLAFAAVVMVTVGVVALSSHTSSVQMDSVVDANRQRATLAKVDPGVRALGLEVLNMTVHGLRWAIMGFDRRRETIIPLTSGPASADWERDFKMFTNALPEASAAMAVYNFEYWVDDESTGVEPIMITWAPQHLTPFEEARAGYYLPAVILALNTDEGRIKTQAMGMDDIGKAKKGHMQTEHTGFSGPYRLESISDTYESFCLNEMGMPDKECALEKGFHNCPFESEDPEEWTDANPCARPECDGASFQRPEGALPGTIPDMCCRYIEDDFCAAPEHYSTMGCHEVTIAAIDRLCEVPRPAAPVNIEWSWAEEAKCTSMCANACGTFLKPEKTWQNCEGCRMDLMPDDNAQNPGQISLCYPGAVGYQMDTCCGSFQSEDGSFFCEQDHNLSSEACNLLEYFDCAWIPQKDCPEYKRSQDIAVSATGCCYHPGSDPEMYNTDASFNFDVEANDWNYESGILDEGIPGVLCADGKYVDHSVQADGLDHHAGEVFAEGQECSAILAEFQAAKDAADAAAAAAAAVTTPAARV